MEKCDPDVVACHRVGAMDDAIHDGLQPREFRDKRLGREPTGTTEAYGRGQPSAHLLSSILDLLNDRPIETKIAQDVGSRSGLSS
jgi:hypothetical protein